MKWWLPLLACICLSLVRCSPPDAPAPLPTHPAFPFTPIARTPRPARAAAPATATPADGVPRIVVGDNFFEATRVVIPVGASVEWVYEGAAAHTATSADAKWPVVMLSPGTHARLAFDAPGIYRYFCSYHAGMFGSIEVVQ